MAGPAEQLQFIHQEELASAELPIHERCLTEVDNLNRHRQADGSHSPFTLSEVFKNLLSATKEAAMPYAIAITEHPYQPTGERDETNRERRAYQWLGRTAVAHALSGKRFHKHAAALKRVEIEVEEAVDNEVNLRPGITKFFISPRMSRLDASYEVAKAEHLADEDSIRVTDVVLDDTGAIEKRVLQSLLVRNIPLEAWVAWLKDPNNLLDKSIEVNNDGSALSVMKVHKQLEVPSNALKEGPVTIIEAVIPYITDAAIRENVKTQLKRFRENQVDMHTKAINIAQRWQNFEIELADSLYEGRATQSIRSFIISLQSHWNEDDLAIIQKHQLANTQFSMSRKLAVIVEQAKQNMLWTRAAIITSNEQVTNQLDPQVINRLYGAEMYLQMAGSAEQARLVEAQSDRVIAEHNIDVGGGCAGSSKPNFDSNNNQSEHNDNTLSSSERKIGKKRRGRCVVQSCPSRPKEVLVGGCGVCLDRCQRLFDLGQDPTKMRAPRQATASNIANLRLVQNQESKAGLDEKTDKTTGTPRDTVSGRAALKSRALDVKLPIAS